MRQIVLISVPVVFLGALLIFVFMLQSTGSAAALCELGTCPIELSAKDRGKTLIYKVGTRFTVDLGRGYPYAQLRCVPGSVASPQSDSEMGLFETIEQGSCTLQGRDFTAYIIVRETGQ